MQHKAFVSKSVEGFSIVAKFDDFSAEQFSSNFGYQITHREDFQSFQQQAKLVTIGSKLKPTFATVKKWVRENKPKQYFAKWRGDSPLYKDDCVDMYVIM